MAHTSRDDILRRCDAILRRYDATLKRCNDIANAFGTTTSEAVADCQRRILSEIKIISDSSDDVNGLTTSLMSVVRLKTTMMTLKALTCKDRTDVIRAIDLVANQLDHDVIRLATDIKTADQESRRRLDAQLKMYSREIDVLEYENEMLRQECN